MSALSHRGGRLDTCSYAILSSDTSLPAVSDHFLPEESTRPKWVLSALFKRIFMKAILISAILALIVRWNTSAITLQDSLEELLFRIMFLCSSDFSRRMADIASDLFSFSFFYIYFRFIYNENTSQVISSIETLNALSLYLPLFNVLKRNKPFLSIMKTRTKDICYLMRVPVISAKMLQFLFCRKK
ncbi:hypothetical protein AVEN_78308-1 [Araneus ventricosus]|uniref:Uncharacterized protein n=1 Tax=Araneus ventricosus TaxID=182803 RepID=A0A4Y2R8N0_ARAVE|nr:hypothetical protein AVEN_78308-1 [Araneus ventricosus]